MHTLAILKPSHCEKVYDIAAEVFQKLYSQITGFTPEIVTEPVEIDMVVIGSDAVNNYVAKLLFDKIINGFDFKYGTDDYRLKSLTIEAQNILLLAGGRGRSTLYAVYDFFERRVGCRYFWDGDIIPNALSVDITGLDVKESPRFEYRGLRYFAHRSLHRFQAEHWSLEDWQKEIDWIVKKRLNLFMLRIGHDDMYQRAFPDIVDYPAPDKKLPEAAGGYDDRTLFWPLQYRGELRGNLLKYAFERDLMHPEDCGTMTHWYARTPLQFLEKVKPKLLSQSSRGYSEQTGLVWDIRDDDNLENYFKLTEAHIKAYGKPELFHTIGLAERSYSNDREENLRLKLYVYRRITRYLKEKYPNSPLLIAGWDLWMFYTGEEVQKLVAELDPQQSIIFDYTSDTARESNFTNWGVVNKFPWIFGIFHGFEPDSDVRGNYDLTEERLAIAKDDDFCKGLVMWPELSHSDTFMLEYLADNAWNPLNKDMGTRIDKFCEDRYIHSTSAMKNIWKRFLPIVKLSAWSVDNTVSMNSNIFFNITSRVNFRETNADVFDNKLALGYGNCQNAVEILDLLSATDICSDDFIRRDAYDIARTICGRYIDFNLLKLQKLICLWKNGEDFKGESVMADCTELMRLLAELLAGHSDYSLYETLEGLKKVTYTNPIFEATLKNNASNGYCRSYIFEVARYLFLPEMNTLFNWVRSSIDQGGRDGLNYPDESFKSCIAEINNEFKRIPLKDMRMEPRSFSETATNIKNIVNKFKENQ